MSYLHVSRITFSGGYEAGRTPRDAGAAHDLADWVAPRTSPDLANINDEDELAGKASDAARNHGLIAGAHQKIAEGVLGEDGLRLKWTPDLDMIPGASEGWFAETKPLIEKAWRRYYRSTCIDVRGQSNGAALMH